MENLGERNYLEELKKQPELYKKLAKVAADYVCGAAKENAFPKGEHPSRSEAEKLLQESGLELDGKSIDSLLLELTEDIFMGRQR